MEEITKIAVEAALSTNPEIILMFYKEKAGDNDAGVFMDGNNKDAIHAIVHAMVNQSVAADIILEAAKVYREQVSVN